ncbi:MAG TPA: Ig-like domain-containing protein [Pseudonocardia sp.]|jgi:lipoprotein-anchoring transpeptidase ErfK/SrfK|uniref:L,D-transpeptidase n=1 Tax=Pseudonocardia sp. TaxID=60912 RepID=UPI002F42C685
MTNRAGAQQRIHLATSIALGVAAVLLAVAGLTTAAAGPAAVNRSLAAKAAPAPPPPPPAAVLSLLTGSITPANTAPGQTAHGQTAPINPATPISPSTPISVSVAHGTLRGVTVTDTKTGQPVPGTLAPDATSWQTSAPLSYADTYQIAASALGAQGRLVQQTGTVATLHPAVLSAVSFRAVGMDTVGVGQPVVVQFSKPVADRAAAERAVRVVSTPAQPGAWYWMSNTEAHYRPASYWQPGSTIQVDADLFGADLGKGTFGQANRAQTLHVHDSWVAKADGRTETMQIFHNGALLNTMPISLGSPSHPSHNGPHVISDKKNSIIMDSCSYGVCQGDAGYYKEKVDLDLRISNDGEFVHSAPWSVGQQGARNVSHGCVNLSPANARWFFDHFNIGDVVEIANSAGPPLPVWDTYGDWELSWPQWQAAGTSS